MILKRHTGRTTGRAPKRPGRALIAAGNDFYRPDPPTKGVAALRAERSAGQGPALSARYDPWREA